MKESKYKILWDYGAYEGMKFHDGEFETIDQAVKEAVSNSYSSPFMIVKMCIWEAMDMEIFKKIEKEDKS